MRSPRLLAWILLGLALTGWQKAEGVPLNTPRCPKTVVQVLGCRVVVYHLGTLPSRLPTTDEELDQVKRQVCPCTNRDFELSGFCLFVYPTARDYSPAIMCVDYRRDALPPGARV